MNHLPIWLSLALLQPVPIEPTPVDLPTITAPNQVSAGELFLVETDNFLGDEDVTGTWRLYPDCMGVEMIEALIDDEKKLLVRYPENLVPTTGFIIFGWYVEADKKVQFLIHQVTIGTPEPGPDPGPLPTPSITAFVKTIIPPGVGLPERTKIKNELFLEVVKAIERGLVLNDNPEAVNKLTATLFKEGNYSLPWKEFMNKLATKLSELSKVGPLDHKKLWQEVANAL